jgi:hypothetical protein
MRQDGSIHLSDTVAERRGDAAGNIALKPSLQVSALFMTDHRELRDRLQTLASVLEDGPENRAVRLLQDLRAWLEPRFRCAEETLYPTLTTVLGRRFFDQLIQRHRHILAILDVLTNLTAAGALTESDRVQESALIRSILQYVAVSSGLGIVIEQLPDSLATLILNARILALAAGQDRYCQAGSERPCAQTLAEKQPLGGPTHF